MLMNNFMTPTALGISDIEFESLVKVLGMLERDEIEESDFDMSMVHWPCGTTACIMGWCQIVSRNDQLFSNYNLQDIIHYKNGGLRNLFMFGDCRRFDKIRAAQAAIALRNYLTTGEPRWAEALAD